MDLLCLWQSFNKSNKQAKVNISKVSRGKAEMSEIKFVKCLKVGSQPKFSGVHSVPASSFPPGFRPLWHPSHMQVPCFAFFFFFCESGIKSNKCTKKEKKHMVSKSKNIWVFGATSRAEIIVSRNYRMPIYRNFQYIEEYIVSNLPNRVSRYSQNQ